MEQLVFHKQPKVKDISVQDLDPRSFGNIDHTSVLAYEMTVIEPGDTPSRTLTWKPLTFLSHIKRRTNDDRFSSTQWESFLCSSLGVPTPFLMGPPQQCPCNAFSYEIFGDHLQNGVKLSQWLLRFMTGWFTRWGHFSVPWVIELRYTKLPRFYDDTCSIWDLTFSPYGSTYEHKELRWCS